MCPDQAAYGLTCMNVAAGRPGGCVLSHLYRLSVRRLADVPGAAAQLGSEAACRVAGRPFDLVQLGPDVCGPRRLPPSTLESRAHRRVEPKAGSTGARLAAVTRQRVRPIWSAPRRVRSVPLGVRVLGRRRTRGRRGVPPEIARFFVRLPDQSGTVRRTSAGVGNYGWSAVTDPDCRSECLNRCGRSGRCRSCASWGGSEAGRPLGYS